MHRKFTIVAIVLILGSILVGNYRKEVIDRVGETMLIEDLKEGAEYIVLSPVYSEFTNMEIGNGIHTIIIAEKSEQLVPVKFFTIVQKNVDKEDYGNLTIGSTMIRNGDRIDLIPPIGLEKEEEEEDKRT